MVSPVADHDGGTIGRNPCQSRRCAYPYIAQHQPLVQIDDGDIRGFGIRDIRPFAVGRYIDEVGSGMHPDGGHNFIAFRINHADAVGLGVDDVDFVFLAVGGNAGRFVADVNGPGRLKGAQVDDRDGVALAVGDVRVLAIGGAVGGQRGVR